MGGSDCEDVFDLDLDWEVERLDFGSPGLGIG